MRNHLKTIAILALIFVAPNGAFAKIDFGTPSADEPTAVTAGTSDGEISGQIETAKLYAVLSMSDDDIEINGRIESGDESIQAASVTGPTGQILMQITQDDIGSVGQADLLFATPELSLEEMKVAYPEGDYEFQVRTVSGKILVGAWTLRYDFATAPELVYPAKGDTGVSRQDLVVRWNAVPDAEAIRFEIEDPVTLIALNIDLPGTSTAFAIPANWRNANTEYVADVKVAGPNGNLIVRDVAFTTGP